MESAIYPQASLMELPVEIRLQIYKEVIAPTTFKVGRPRWHPRFNSITAFNVQLVGTAPKRYNSATDFSQTTGSPKNSPADPWAVPRRHTVWALTLVCRKMSGEVAPLLGAIDLGEDVHFSFFAFTKEDLALWARKMGPDRLARVKRWSMDGFGFCNLWAQQAKESCLQSGMVSLKCLPVPADTARNLLAKDTWGPGEFDSIGYCYRDVIVDLRVYDPRYASWRWLSEQSAKGRDLPTYSDRSCPLLDDNVDHSRCSWTVRDNLTYRLRMRRELNAYPELAMSLEFLAEVLGCIMDVPPLDYIQTRTEG